jgi:type IV pilus assembly protein PilA
MKGFTLLELMMVVAIMGVLASIAVPEFQNMEYRSKLAERDSILAAIEQAVQDVTLNSNTIPTTAGTFFSGNWNPDTHPGPTVRPWVQGQPGWNSLGMVVTGSTYCSYFFNLNTVTMELTIVGDCDTDGDGNHSTRTQLYQGMGNSFVLVSDTVNDLNAF